MLSPCELRLPSYPTPHTRATWREKTNQDGPAPAEKKAGSPETRAARGVGGDSAQFAVSVVVAVFPPWFTPMVVVPVVLVVASPGFTGALVIVATLGTVELQCELMLMSCVELSLKVPKAMNCCVLP